VNKNELFILIDNYIKEEVSKALSGNHLQVESVTQGSTDNTDNTDNTGTRPKMVSFIPSTKR
jgi:hypothetical protein